MTQAEFNQMLSTAVAQGIVGGTYISQFDGEEIDGAIKRFSNPNLLDNWYFPAAINQKGATSWDRFGYYIDRWHEAVDHIPGSIDSKGWHLGAKQCAIQYIPKEEMDLLRGKQATISILLSDGRFAFGSGVIGTGVVQAIIPGTLNFEVAIFDSVNSYQTGRLVVYQDITVQAVKLELGNRQTLAHQDTSGKWVLNDPPPNRALELAKCQRYYQKILRTSLAFGPKIGSVSVSTPIFYPAMRINPALTIGTFDDPLVEIFEADMNKLGVYSGINSTYFSIVDDALSTRFANKTIVINNVSLDANL